MHRALLPVLLLVLTGCVGYRPESVSAPHAAARFGEVRRGALSFEEAVRLLVERNPELAALRAEVSAVNLRPGPDPLVASQEFRDGRATDLLVGTDVLSLLGIGPRGAKRALARAMRDEAVLRHHERARDLVADLAEAFAVDRALRSLATPHPDLDVEPFRKAGLITDADTAAANAVHAEADAEKRVIDLALADNRREIARLIGAAPESTVVPQDEPEAWPPVPEPSARGVLFARGDLQRLAAEFTVADRRLRLAVAEQIPNLGLSLGEDLDVTDPLQMVEISVPLGAPAEARAASCAREAARRRFEAGVFDALHDAASARLALQSAEAEVLGTRSRRSAASSLVTASRTRVQIETGAIADLVIVSGEEVSAARELRSAEVERARARVRAAKAAGWPGPEVAGGVR